MAARRTSPTLAPLLRGLPLALGLALAGCGGLGEAEEESCSLCGDLNDLTGSIANKTGNQAVMNAWVVASIERDSMIARVGEVNTAGLFELKKVRTDRQQTLALFTPDYIVQSVLSIPNDTPNTIRQMVNYTSAYIPRLINNGPVITFQEMRGISAGRDLAADADGDGIPDGSVSLGAGALSLNGPAGGFSLAGGFALAGGDTIDTDRDNIINEKDPDIDGDGIVNILDPDDNGNKILDVFDGDANGDYSTDTDPGQKDTDGWFSEGVEYVSVQFEMRPLDTDAGGYETSLKFGAKVRDNMVPLAVQVRGAPSLLNNSTYVGYDADGNPVAGQTWNRLLLDDGHSEDGNPNDRVFGQKVTLASGKSPRAHEAVFFQLAFGDESNPWYMEFPYVFPNLKPTAISTNYDANTKTVLLIGNPFGSEITDFIWTIQVFKEGEDQAMWISRAIPGSTRKYAIQENILESGVNYRYSVVAQTLDKIGGTPAYAIYSKTSDLN